MEFSPRTLWPLTAAGLLAVVVVASVAGSVIPGSHPASNVPPDELPAAPALAGSPTPTPRVIDIPGATTPAASPPISLPAPTQAAAALPTAADESAPDAAPSPTPWVMVADAPAATSAPAAQPSPTSPPATAIPTPEPTPSPTPSPAPTATSAATPTLQAGQPLRLEFAAEDWTGGYFRGDGQAYGRPWIALYGAKSDYPRTRLTFTLDTAPNANATLIVVGLDDEWAELNAIAVEVNGQEIFSGTAPFANWGGIGNGANADWTPVAFDLPSDVLRAGRNRVTFTSLMPSANFNAPPYLLLSQAVLEIDGQAAESDPAATGDAAARGGDRDQREQIKPSKDKDKDKGKKKGNKPKKEKRKRGKNRKR